MPWSVRLGSRRLVAAWWLTALTLIGVVTFIALGDWQWGRAVQKRQLQRAFAVGGAQSQPVDSRSIGHVQRYAGVVASGHYDNAHQFLLDNMTRDGRVGYEVLTPLVLDDGSAILVNRGWLPLAGGARAQLPAIAPAVTGRTSVLGRADLLPVAGLGAGRAAPPADGNWPKLTSFPTVTQLATALGRTLATRQILMRADQPAGFERDWRPVGAAFGPERHQAYAVQWWSFAALAVVLFFFLNQKRVDA